eukprot:CAMPEP_0119334404 /NCGR_PEP_ID=MMETSP1333-20130426/87281_1 /TAXON_ID=418940 /ORGANISM="Scyphosphaera apsteinii, Strain RCC1455" /LENGTH=114 /DNA_ID=CAMNT_0007344691 /DNA_START=371 /DNA_END=716 /DNA_ORIENTATION=+
MELFAWFKPGGRRDAGIAERVTTRRSMIGHKSKIRRMTSGGRERMDGTQSSARRGTAVFEAPIKNARRDGNCSGMARSTTSRRTLGPQQAQPPNGLERCPRLMITILWTLMDHQ